MHKNYTKVLLSALFILIASVTTFAQNQDFSLIIGSPTHQINYTNGTANIIACPQDTIIIIANGNYYQNNTTYNQSDNTTTFNWSTSLSYTTTQNFIKIFTTGQVNDTVTLTAFDTQSHQSDLMLPIIISVESNIPSFSGTSTLFDTICQNSYTAIIGNIIGDGNYSAITNNGVTTYLPDGSGVSYTSSLAVNSSSRQNIITPNDISVFATLEHSYLGDLDIELICPSNVSITLKSYPGGSGTYLGEPIDGNAQQVPGIGYEYHWENNGSTTMTNAVGSYVYNYTNQSGLAVYSAGYLPPSYSYPSNSTITSNTSLVVYKPEDSLSNLIGCPINGTWTIKITDNLGIDNGFIFDWGIKLDTSIVKLSTNRIISQGWESSTGVVSNNGNVISVYPETAGIHNFTFSAMDSSTCIFDTTVSIYALPIPDLELGNDTTICADQSISFDAGNGNLSQFWSTGSNYQIVTLDSTNIGIGSTTINIKIEDYNHCNNYDTITITFAECTYINNNDEIIKVKIYPNPSKGQFIIDAEFTTKEDIIVQIFDLYGKEVYNKIAINNYGKIHHNINISDLSKGTYFIKIQTKEEHIHLKKLIIN